MLARVAHQLSRGVKAHRLAVEQRGQKRIRVVVLEPGADIDQQRKARGMALREAVLAKALDLLEDALGIFGLVALGHHATDQPLVERPDTALAFPGRHRPAQAVGLAGAEVSGQDRQLHHLLLEDRYTQRSLKRLANLVAGIVDRLLARAPAQVRVHHAALDRPRPHDRDLDHQVVEGARLQPRQHAHLGSALDLESAHAVAAAQHLIDRCVLGRHALHVEARQAQLVAHHRQRAADRAEHAQRQDVDLDQPQRVEVVFVPLDHGAPVHRGVLHRHQARDVVAGDHEAARVLAEVARKADQLLRQRHPLATDQRVRIEALRLQALGCDGPAAPGAGAPEHSRLRARR